MGLFVQRPEEPSEWAGLPGEPARPRTKAELLPDDDRPIASPTGLLGIGNDSTTSIAIPLGHSVEAADGD
ncbi:hypothetical protein [Microbacterium sp. Leaf151]|uniref:hypothetical protein n=1 Tax=Microbacterium sp. Leaf151 TaxID=1736276 RepID=UPI0006F2C89B|nr:hypothetical protein [Microbacterium sp. Leaf151]KQR25045.1 hypothetical protein ASF76_05140 [Microbacterium sp. Leaf151]